MKNKPNVKLNPAYRAMSLSAIYAAKANGFLGRMMMRRDRPAPRLLRCRPA